MNLAEFGYCGCERCCAHTTDQATFQELSGCRLNPAM